MKLEGKTALVTGGASGIGEAISIILGEAGARVVVNYNHSETKARNIVAKLQQSGHQALCYQADVSEFEQAKALVEHAFEAFGNIDILVNNAGITKDQLLLRMSEEDFDLVLKTNLKGTWNMVKLITPMMAKNRFGRIINIASVAGLTGNAGQVNYAASKAGVIGLTKSVAREFAKRNVTANSIAPGFIETLMTEKLPLETKEKYLKEIPLGRFGKPEDVAKVVLFLASDEACYITGQTLNVDGGLVMY
ncbi:MAG: 3-oxoacyl-[acyl-carrier-protein] reductase [Bacilli bacterium]|nr:3-oxoacyl-[acyl-carrier-protein] reductase [Bacilli bacterium]MBN2696597.1 3-oxoacyl-[acyl-carrier-protein] reductase [Bacilli bacterium]